MDWLRELQIDAVTVLVTGGARAASNAGDKTMKSVLKSIRAITPDENARAGLDELIDAIEMGPPNTDTLRRMLRESKYSELREFVEGQFFFREMDAEDL